LIALKAINKSLCNGHDVSDDILRKFLDKEGKDVEFRLCLLTWHFDARETLIIPQELVNFVRASCSGRDMEIDSGYVGIIEGIWGGSKYRRGPGKETNKQFLNKLIDIIVSKLLKK
jgi:hypothetical protein